MSKPERSPSGIARPLVVRCGAFGDMVLITVLIQRLAARFGCPVDVLTSGPWSKALLRDQPGVGEVYCVRSRKTPFWLSWDLQRMVGRLRARGMGPVWYCDGDRAAWSLLQRAGIDVRWIVDVKDHPLNPGEHATEQWRRLGRLLPPAQAPVAEADEAESPASVPQGGCHLVVSDAERVAFGQWLRTRLPAALPVIAVQMGNKRTMRRGLKRLAVNHKYWPLERWVTVLRHVRARQPGHAILLLGTGPEQALNRTVAAAAGIDGLYNVADDLPVPRLLALLACAEGLITVDSGPAHAAAALGCPQVVLFGRASIPLYRPWGRPGAEVIVLQGMQDGAASMLGIGADTVMAAWDSLHLRTAG